MLLIMVMVLRFIPAYAGNSTLNNVTFQTCAVHPRLRGELNYETSSFNPQNGSSPLTRGTRIDHTFCRIKVRFIPAYAGNSQNSEFLLYPNTVHPRLRGELTWNGRRHQNGAGSSPLTRGTRIHSNKRIDTERFIPAYAGNSHSENNNSIN